MNLLPLFLILARAQPLVSVSALLIGYCLDATVWRREGIRPPRDHVGNLGWFSADSSGEVARELWNLGEIRRLTDRA